MIIDAHRRCKEGRLISNVVHHHFSTSITNFINLQTVDIKVFMVELFFKINILDGIHPLLKWIHFLFTNAFIFRSLFTTVYQLRHENCIEIHLNAKNFPYEAILRFLKMRKIKSDAKFTISQVLRQQWTNEISTYLLGTTTPVNIKDAIASLFSSWQDVIPICSTNVRGRVWVRAQSWSRACARARAKIRARAKLRVTMRIVLFGSFLYVSTLYHFLIAAINNNICNKRCVNIIKCE